MTRILALIYALACVSYAAKAGQSSFVTINVRNGLADNSAQTLFCTEKGRLIVSTIGHINLYNGDSFSHLYSDDADEYTLKKYLGRYHLYVDSKDRAWLKDRNMVKCLDITTEQFCKDISKVFISEGVRGTVDDLFVDSSGRLWLLCGNALFGESVKHTITVDEKQVLQDVETEGNRLFLFYDDSSVEIHDMSNGKTVGRTYSLFGADREKYFRTSVLLKHGNKIYQVRNARSDGGILQEYDINAGTFKMMMELPYTMAGMAVFNDNMYVASQYGYWKCNLKDGTKEHVEYLMLDDGTKLYTDINAILFDKQGGMWIGTQKRGLLYAKQFPSPFNSYHWSDPRYGEYEAIVDKVEMDEEKIKERGVICYFQDSRGWQWTGTNAGLRLLKKGQNVPVVFTENDGLVNSVIHSVVEDKNNNIWVATSGGISMIEITNGAITFINNHQIEDNVPTESFVPGKAICLDDGRIIMKSVDHVVVFDPSVFKSSKRNLFVLNPFFSQLYVNGQLMHAGEKIDDNVPLVKSAAHTDKIELNYNQNSVILVFSGLNYFRPRQTYYRVRVIGIDDKWKVMSHNDSEDLVDNNGILRYRLFGLNPGEYRVEVQVSMRPDVWDGETRVVNLSIKEPWWRTTGMIVTLLVVILVLLVANFRIFGLNYRIKLKQVQLEGDVIRKIQNFINRAEGIADNPKQLNMGDDNVDDDNENNKLEPEFISVMLSMIPLFNKRKTEDVTLSMLRDNAGYSKEKFYKLLVRNIFKNPRMLAKAILLQRARNMLIETNKSVDDIALAMGYDSTNAFISSFYHAYKKTPMAYREMMGKK